MALYTLTEQLDAIDDKIYTTQELEKTSLFFSSDLDNEDFLRFLPGMKWSVTYYNQYVNTNDILSPPDVNTSQTQQRYKRIRGLTLFVDSGLENVSPEDLSGEATVNAGFIPNLMDVFVAEMANGRRGMFIVNTVSAKHYNQHNVYEISYSFFAFADTDVELFNNVEYKSIQTFRYNTEFIIHGGSPLLTQDDFDIKRNMSNVLNNMLVEYFNKFGSKSNGIMYVPTVTGKVYDPYFMKLLTKIYEHSSVRSSTYNMSPDLADDDNIRTVWDCILEGDRNGLMYVVKPKPIYVKTSSVTRFKRQVGYLGIDYVYGTDDAMNDFSLSVDNNDNGTPTTTSITYDRNSYVFSSGFYANNPELSTDVERVILAMMDVDGGAGVISLDVLNGFINDYYKWSPYKKFYLTPILVMMMKSVGASVWYRG